MGEPLLALPSVVQAYKLLNEQLGIGGRYITISTVGELFFSVSNHVAASEHFSIHFNPSALLFNAH